MKIFGFVKKLFFVGLTILSGFASVNSLSCISMNNHECKLRPQVVNVNGYEPVFFPFSTETSKFNCSCNNINYPYVKICVLDVVKNLNVTVFNLMSITNEIKHIEQHEMCKCEWKCGANACNNKQRWNKGKCRCGCKELIDTRMCDKGFIWNPNNCDCDCDKACGVGEYLDYKNCKCIKKLVAPLIEECAEAVKEVKLAKITLPENENSCKCNPSTVYIVLMVVFFITCTGISTYFVCYNWPLVKNNVSRIMFGTHTQKTIY